jgi:putative ABC transport system permease protein
MVTTLVTLLPSVVGVVVLTALATGVLMAFRVRGPWSPATAIVRGALQLAVLSVILTGIISSAAWIALALVVMFTVAATVAARRIGWTVRTAGMTASSMAAGILLSLVVVFTTGALQLTPRYALAIGAIVIGNSMSIATLTGRHFVSGVRDRWDQVEGWLALGATPRQSTLEQARRAVREALVPTIDQTKTTGLVVLPGAFVGAIFGGISPLEAGRFQLVVLATIMAAGAITAVLNVLWLGPVQTKPRAVR